ncbi:replication protein A 70 kDa DNA-binding subunit B [Artemisia annua]|uniref:Replication protein A 70 kDa DNA-binding subunit B n=1 Tax=Artemisia annua TaxID=35608 RepID=A0A2U1QEL5_ARTAN|nr:replication protein A 70 kDa DNA-binding subunit B [Artemisia annua]
MVGNIRDSDRACHVVVYGKIHKIHREHGWAYLACKRCGSAAKEVHGTTSWKCKQHNQITAVGMRFKVIVRVIDDTGSASLLLFDDLVKKLCGVTCHNLIKQYGEDHESYFPSELNVMVGKQLLFRFHYTDYNMNNNNHVYQVKMMSEEEIVINAFKTDFITEEPVNAAEMQTPVLSAVKKSKFSSGENIPFNIEATPPTAKGIQDSGDDTGSSRSGKRTIIDLDGYDDSKQEAKRLQTEGDVQLVEVKKEPKE